MYKETITYTDFNGNECKEDFYFNLTPAELLEMELTTPGGMGSMLTKIVDARNEGEIIRVFKDLILKSYGKKSLDGKRFEKSPEISQEFSQTAAYSVFFMKLANDSDAAAEFIRGIIPNDIQNASSKAPLSVA